MIKIDPCLLVRYNVTVSYQKSIKLIELLPLLGDNNTVDNASLIAED